MEEVLYVVDGWDGDAEYFHNEENYGFGNLRL